MPGAGATGRAPMHDQAGPNQAGVEWIASTEPVAYPDAIDFMDRRVLAIRRGAAPECVWRLEHPPLLTAGTSAAADELLDPGGLPVYRTGRGGRYTYHGPGQLVAYTLLDLRPRGSDLRRFVHGLEEWIIRALAEFGLGGERRAGRVGIWVTGAGGEAKIAALGIRVRRWVSMHGIAINIDPELDAFRRIIPCGIRQHGVTSLRAEGVEAGPAAVEAALRRHFAPVWGAPLADTRRVRTTPDGPAAES